MTRGRKRNGYSAAEKAAVMAALLAGQGTAQVAAGYKIPEGTVRGWRSAVKNGGALATATVVTAKREQIGDLLIDYLHANLTTLRKQQETFSDPTWLAKQGANELAILHGVMTDKAIRLLEALGGASNRPG